MKNLIPLYINGERYDVSDQDAFLPLADFLRYRKHKTGTKIVCAEGDCGACTILVSKDENYQSYNSINSCIGFVFQFAYKSIITVDALSNGDSLSTVQDAMAKNHGAQCGYCTPGIICSLTNLANDAKEKNFTICDKKTKNYLTGNLCRCTGYEPIIRAANEIDLSSFIPLRDKYTLSSIKKESLLISSDLLEVFIPVSLKDALRYKNDNPTCRIVSGATDLGVQSNKRRIKLEKILYLGMISELDNFTEHDDKVEVGALVNLSDLEKKIESNFNELSNLLKVFASPQIKNAGSIVGNLANGSPIGDTIPFLLVSEAKLEIQSIDSKRIVDINNFYLGYKTFDLKPNEIIIKVIIPKTDDIFKLYKVSLRKDLDISAVTFAGRISKENKKIKDIKLALGGVAATVLRLTEIEKDLLGSDLDINQFKNAAIKVKGMINPFSDVRGSSEFRKQLSHNLLMKFYKDIEVNL